MFFETETLAGTIDFVGSSGDLDETSGNGPAAEATLFVPFGIAVTPSGTVYVTETLFNGIRKIENGVVSTLTSRKQGSTDGPLSQALFNGPTGIVSDQAGNLYVADQGNHRNPQDRHVRQRHDCCGAFGARETRGLGRRLSEPGPL